MQSLQPQQQRRASDVRRLSAVPTQQSLTRILQGAEPVDDAIDGRTRPAPRAGILLPNSSLSNYVPNVLVDMIVARVGPRHTPPIELQQEAERYTLFLQHKSLKYRNETTNERVDFNSSRQEWWNTFLHQLLNCSIQNHVTIRIELRALETQLHMCRSDDDVNMNEWLATQDSADNVEYYDSAFGVADAASDNNNWYNDVYSECLKPDVNCLQIDIIIGDTDEAFDNKQLCLSHSAVLNVVKALPANSMSSPREFSVVFRQEEQQSRVSLVLYSPLFVRQCHLPQESLFDATAWMRQFINRNRMETMTIFGQTLEYEEVAMDQNILFNLQFSLATMIYRRQKSKVAWLYFIQSLLEIRQLYQIDFDVMKLNLDPESHETRHNQTQDNLMSASRDSALHITLDEHDFSGQHLVNNNQADLVDDIEATIREDADWNTIHLQFTLDHANADSTPTIDQLLQYPGILRFFARFETLLNLPNEQVSLIVKPLASGWSYVTLLLYSPEFVLDCTQAAKTRMQRLGATQQLKQAILSRSNAHQNNN